MKLRQTIIDSLLNSRTLRLRLADDLRFSELWINRLISANKDNGPLTTAKSLQALREELGVTDLEILEEDAAHADVK